MFISEEEAMLDSNFLKEADKYSAAVFFNLSVRVLSVKAFSILISPNGKMAWPVIFPFLDI